MAGPAAQEMDLAIDDLKDARMNNQLSDLLRRWFPRVRAPALQETLHQQEIDGVTRQLASSRFNIAWLAEYGIQPSLIIDAGSYDGGDALRFAAAFPQSRVIAIEADADRFAIVRSTLRATRIEVHNVAANDRDGPVDWYPAKIDGRPSAQGSIYRQSDALDQAFPFVRQAQQSMTVSGRRLDSLCRELAIEHVDLLHMDIQGAEHAALMGLGTMRPKMIFLETQNDKKAWIGSASSVATRNLLRQMGYRMAADFRSDRLYVLVR